jgi:hypothetical protein
MDGKGDWRDGVFVERCDAVSPTRVDLRACEASAETRSSRLDLYQAARTETAGQRRPGSSAALTIVLIETVMKKHLLAILAGFTCVLLAIGAEARSAYDGQWSITFVTQSGDCNPTYNFSVNIENGVITSPNAETFRGNVTSSGAVRASVAVQEKRASGSGKLKGVLGRGTWNGWSGEQRCAGSWTAQRSW